MGEDMVSEIGVSNDLAQKNDSGLQLDFFRLHMALTENGALGLKVGESVIDLPDNYEETLQEIFQTVPGEARDQLAEQYKAFLGTEDGIYAQGDLKKLEDGILNLPDSIQGVPALALADATNSAKPYPDVVVRAIDQLDVQDFDSEKGFGNMDLVDTAMEQEPAAFQDAMTAKIGHMLDPDGDGRISRFDLNAGEAGMEALQELSVLDNTINTGYMDVIQNSIEDLKSGEAGFTITDNITPVFVQSAADLPKGDHSIDDPIQDINPTNPVLQVNAEEPAPEVTQMGTAPVAPPELLGDEPIVYAYKGGDPLDVNELTEQDPAGTEMNYTVQRGDTLSQMVQCHYDLTSYEDVQKYTEMVAKANNIEDIHKIQVGQEITLPGREPMDDAAKQHEVADNWYTPEAEQMALNRELECGLCEAPLDKGASDVSVVSAAKI